MLHSFNNDNLASGNTPTPSSLPHPFCPKNKIQQKLTEEEVKALHHQSSATVGSAWNAAGSFEEKDVSKQAIERLKTLLNGHATTSSNNNNKVFSIIEVISCSGEATLFFVRGRKRCGLEFQLELKWKYSNSSITTTQKEKKKEEEQEGRLIIPNACLDELDELEINLIDASVLDATIKTQVKELTAAAVCDVLKQLGEELLSSP